MKEDNKSEISLKDLTEEELSQIAKAQGGKLAFLIANSNLSQEEQQALVDATDKMSLEQIEKLLNIFEAKLLDEATRHIDVEYKEKIEKKVKEFQEDKEIGKKKLQKQIDSILAL